MIKDKNELMIGLTELIDEMRTYTRGARDADPNNEVYMIISRNLSDLQQFIMELSE